jgi:hypothetical protein
MSITLTTPKTVSINGVQQENDTQGAATLLSYDFLANVATLRFSIGSGAPSAFNVGVYDTPILLTVNMTTGAWTAVNTQSGTGVGSGTFSGAGFTSFQSQFKSIRNAAETFASTQFMPGTQVAWT